MIGAALSGVVALGTVYVTRWYERRSTREELAFQAAEDIALALLRLETALRPRPWVTRAGWQALWEAADEFGDVIIVRLAALEAPMLAASVSDAYNLVFEALRIMRVKAASNAPPELQALDMEVLLRDTTSYFEAVVNALTAWRRAGRAVAPSVPDLAWRALSPQGPPQMGYGFRRRRRGLLRRP
jgi:hypothetical protein